jgi:hypothetical protein
MKSRYVVAIILGATLILAGAGCRKEVPPDRPSQASGPDHTWTGIPTAYAVSAHIDRGTIRFVTDWGDMVDTTDARYAPGETATIMHVWTSPGAMSVKVQAINSAAPEKASLWSWPESVDVILDSLPVIDTVEAPSVAMKGTDVYFIVRASDPDRDSIKIHIDWGDGKDTANEFHGYPYYFGFYPSHIFAQVGTAKVIVTAQDRKGATSLPETALVRVDTIGAVIWSHGAPWASPLVVNDGFEDCVYSLPWPSGDPPGSRFSGLTEAAISSTRLSHFHMMALPIALRRSISLAGDWAFGLWTGSCMWRGGWRRPSPRVGVTPQSAATRFTSTTITAACTASSTALTTAYVRRPSPRKEVSPAHR